MTDEQLGWVAGLFEGEGTIGATAMARARKSDGVRRHSIRVTVTQADEDIIDRLIAWTGVGHKWGPRQSKQFPGARPTYWWMLQRGEQLDAFVCSIFHLLSPRRRAQVLRAYAKWAENR